jgi:hypothetical protein
MLLLTLLLLGPAQETSQPAEPTDVRKSSTTRPYDRCVAVELWPVLAHPTQVVSTPRSRFSAASTLDLQFRATLRRDVAPGSRLEFHVVTPQGHLYQRLPAVATLPTPPAKPEPWAPMAEARPPGPPAPQATATLLVAGTAIVNHSLYGQWLVEPHIEGDPRPCAPASRFWITP